MVEQAPQGQGLGGFERLMQQVSGLTPAGRPGPVVEAVPPAGRQGCSAAMPQTIEGQRQAYAESLAGRQSCPAAPATMFLPLSGGMGATQVPASSAHLPSGMAAPQPPSQGLGPSTSPGLLAGLVTGMRQLQDVLIKKEQATSSADEPKTVKPGVSSFPKLKGIDPNTLPIDFQDWVTLLKAPMHDMSATSQLWWAQVVHEAEQAYQRFATASPIEKLQVKPNIPVELTMGKWSRVNIRATSMLLAAIEDDLRTEMVNRRMCDSAVGILYRLMTLYAPGGESEKTLTLNKLQNPTRCTDAQSAAEELRAWERWKNRAQTLGLLTPDPTILVRAVAGITAGVFDKGQNCEMAHCNAVPQPCSFYPQSGRAWSQAHRPEGLV